MIWWWVLRCWFGCDACFSGLWFVCRLFFWFGWVGWFGCCVCVAVGYLLCVCVGVCSGVDLLRVSLVWVIVGLLVGLAVVLRVQLH